MEMFQSSDGATELQLTDRDATFRAHLAAWEILESASSLSKAIKYTFEIESQWDEESETWVDWPKGHAASKAAWFCGKTGAINERAISSMAEVGLWPAKFAMVSEPPPEALTSIRVMITTEESDYNGRVSHDISWVNEDGERPRGGKKAATPEALNALDAQFGGAIRAITGGKAPGIAPPPPGAVSIDKEDAPF